MSAYCLTCMYSCLSTLIHDNFVPFYKALTHKTSDEIRNYDYMNWCITVFIWSLEYAQKINSIKLRQLGLSSNNNTKILAGVNFGKNVQLWLYFILDAVEYACRFDRYLQRVPVCISGSSFTLIAVGLFEYPRCILRSLGTLQHR